MSPTAIPSSELQVLASSLARRIDRKASAERVGVSKRTLEDWGRTWAAAEVLGKPELRKGPPPFRVSRKRVLYEVRHLDHFRSYYKRWDDATAYWKDPPDPMTVVAVST